MANRKPEEPREETRKQANIRRRDAEANRKIMIALVAVGVLLVLLIGAGIVQELLIKPNQPVATVNSRAIPLRDYQQAVKYAWFQQGQVTDPEGTSLEVLDQLIDVELLREQAQQRNITVSDDEITETIEQLFGYQRVPPTPVPTPTPDPNAPSSSEPAATPAPTATPITLEAYQEAYQSYLDRLDQTVGMNEAAFREYIEQDLLREKLYEDVTKDVATTAEQVRARHILIAIRTPAPTPEPTATGGPTPDPQATPAPTATPAPEPRNEAQALALALEVQQRLNAGEDFAALAQEYSDDLGSKDSGGELGWFARDEGLVIEFEEAAFSLQPGQVSEPVLTQFGYHLIEVEERDPARELDAFTVQQRKFEAYQQWLTTLRDSANIDRRWAPEKVPPTPSARL